MALPARELEVILAEVRDEVRALRREVAELRRQERRLLSQRDAAKSMGIGRDQVAALVRSGRLRLVMGKIPADDLARFVQEGGCEPRPKARRSAPAPANEAAAIRALKV